MKSKSILLAALIAVTAIWATPATAHAQIFITYSVDGSYSNERVGEYSLSGAPINASLIGPLSEGTGLALSGSNLFVVSSFYGQMSKFSTSGVQVPGFGVNVGNSAGSNLGMYGSDLFVASFGTGGFNADGAIGEYTTSGATVNSALITGLISPRGVAVSGSNLFVINYNIGTIGEYTLSGATVNAALITGLHFPSAIVVSGSNIFVANNSTGTIGEYTTSGATVNAALITGLSQPYGLALSDDRLFVTNYVTNQQGSGTVGAGTVGEYTTSGATVNAALISGLTGPYAIALVPEPSTWALLAMGAGALLLGRRRR